MVRVYLEIHEGKIYGWGSQINDAPFVDLPEDHDFFKNRFAYKYENGELIFVEENVVVIEKENKIKELSFECQKTIVGRFIADVNGVPYQFSNDVEAQINFDKLLGAFDRGMVTEIPWTAYDMEGNVVRVVLNQTAFQVVYMAHLNHIQSNIAKFRDVLQPQVEQSTDITQLKNISWE